jgi:hypothetical protein
VHGLFVLHPDGLIRPERSATRPEQPVVKGRADKLDSSRSQEARMVRLGRSGLRILHLGRQASWRRYSQKKDNRHRETHAIQDTVSSYQPDKRSKRVRHD